MKEREWEESSTWRERTRHEKITINGVGLWVGLRSEKPNLKPKGEKQKKNEKRKKWALGFGSG